MISTLNSPASEVRLAAVEYNSQVSGSNVELAVVNFEVVASSDSTSSMNVLISSMQTANSVDISAQNTFSVASVGNVIVGM